MAKFKLPRHLVYCNLKGIIGLCVITVQAIIVHNNVQFIFTTRKFEYFKHLFSFFFLSQYIETPYHTLDYQYTKIVTNIFGQGNFSKSQFWASKKDFVSKCDVSLQTIVFVQVAYTMPLLLLLQKNYNSIFTLSSVDF